MGLEADRIFAAILVKDSKLEVTCFATFAFCQEVYRLEPAGINRSNHFWNALAPR